MYVLYIIFAILMFGFLITIHEFGHFITAKLFGVKVNEFSICMGPAIWKKQKGETLYALRCIPLGGYCAMEGEDQDSQDPRSFPKAAWWKRLIILAAGAAMNFLAGLLIFACVFGISSQYRYIGQPVIGQFYEGNTVAGEDGLQEGDRFYSIDGERVYIANDVSLLLQLNLSGSATVHDLVVIRDGKKGELSNFSMEKQQFQTEKGPQVLYGFTLSSEPRTLGNLASYVWNSAIETVRNVRLSLQLLFRGDVGIDEVAGPVGIVKTIADVGTEASSPSIAWNSVLLLAAFIAVNLAVMNLLPLPALDGGRILGVLLTTGVEAITRKKLNPKIEGYIHAGGMAVLLVFMAFIMLKDVIQIFH